MVICTGQKGWTDRTVIKATIISMSGKLSGEGVSIREMPGQWF